MIREHARKEENLNLKTADGGLADLEFLIQSVQLENAREHPRIIQANTFSAAAEIGRARLLRKSDLTKVEKNLDFFRRLETHVRMNSETADFSLPPDGSRLRAISAAMGASSPVVLVRVVDRVRRENSALFANFLKTRLI